MAGNPQIGRSWRKRRDLAEMPAVAVVAAGSDWSADKCLKCPASGTDVFGRVPKMHVRGGPTFPAGEIYLRYGIHYGANNGFGFQHIWAEHFPHVVDHDQAIFEIIKAVSLILQPQTEVFYEASRQSKPSATKRDERASVFRLSAGQVVIELRGGNLPHYSIVTGGFNPGQKKGSLIGALV